MALTSLGRFSFPVLKILPFTHFRELARLPIMRCGRSTPLICYRDGVVLFSVLYTNMFWRAGQWAYDESVMRLDGVCKRNSLHGKFILAAV